MLFNSPEFIFIFLPITLLIFFLLSYFRKIQAATGALVLGSLFFYGWWKPEYLLLLIVSLVFNFLISKQLHSLRKDSLARVYLILGIGINLGLIGYYKYTNFGLEIINSVFETKFAYLALFLPLGISFFTFQQIAYLVDVYRGITKPISFLHYCLFVTFFPQLIAGPIVHSRQVIGQFENDETFHVDWNKIALGVFIFTLGLFKKAVLADGIAGFANPIFAAVDQGLVVTTLEAWGAALAFSMQLYFDFSGYSDMAIGLGFMFGIRLPQNFYSPYKASNIADFWRRWHMTLSQFLRDYIYIPLGGNRKGEVRRYTNLMATMLIGGLWHGAGWNFIIWGGLHGAYLVINHAYAKIATVIPKILNPFRIHVVSVLVTFLAVVLAGVFFRASTFGGAATIIKAMLFFNGVTLPADVATGLTLMGKENLISTLEGMGLHFSNVSSHVAIQDWGLAGVPLIVLLLFLTWFTPNAYDIVRKFKFIDGDDWKILPEGFNSLQGRFLAMCTGIVFFIGITTILAETPSEFLYFNF